MTPNHCMPFERKCRPSDLVRFLATLLLTILPSIPLGLQPNAPGHGSSDAGEDNDRVAIGGWFATSPNPKKEDVFWFSMDVKQTPWAQALLAHTSATCRIGDTRNARVPGALYAGS